MRPCRTPPPRPWHRNRPPMPRRPRWGINAALAEPLAEDIETVAARRAGQQAAKRRRWHASGWSTAILALIAVNLALDRLARGGGAMAATDGIALCGDRVTGQSA